MLIPLDFVPRTLQARDPLANPRLLALCIVTCELLVRFAVSVASRPARN